jgi:hypothetical protein
VSSVLSRISDILNSPSLSNDEKIERIKAEVEAPPILGIIGRLVAAPESDGGFAWANPGIADANCLTAAEPSLEGASLDEIVGSKERVLAELGRRGRRAANVAEGLLYGIKNPEEQRKYWIWCLGQTLVLQNNGALREYALVLDVLREQRCADLSLVLHGVREGDRVLSFPL